MKTTKLISAVMLLVCMMSMISLSSCSEKDDDGEKKEAGSSNLRVTPASLKFDATGGTKSLIVTTTYEMVGVETTADWLDYDFNEATGLVHITATANNTDKARSTNLQVMGSNDGNTIKERVNIKVEQEAGSVDEGDAVFTVDSKGGKIEYGEISIDFPSGTFNSATKVSLIEQEKGTLGGESELSKYYKVKLSAGIRKSFKVGIMSNEYATDDNIKIQFTTNGYSPSLDEEGLVHNFIDVNYSDGKYICEISAMDSPDEAGESEIYFGLCQTYSFDDISPDGTRSPKAKPKLNCLFYNRPANYRDIAAFLRSESGLTDAIGKIEDLGFVPYQLDPKKEKEAPNSQQENKEKVIIKYYIEPLWIKPFSGGAYYHSYFGKKYGIIKLNKTKLEKYSKNEYNNSLMATVIHETFHFYQVFYDPRSIWSIIATRKGSLILDEAGSVWSEMFYMGKDAKGNYKSPTLTRDHVTQFLASIKYFSDDIHRNGAANLYWSDRYQNTGYGMSALIGYLYKKFGKEIVLDIFEERRDNSDVEDVIGIIDRSIKKSKSDFNIFSHDGYRDMIENLGNRKVFSDFSFYDFVPINANSLRVTDGNCGPLNKELWPEETVTFENKVWGYGALVERLDTKASLIEATYGGFKKVKTIAEQKNPKITTWVYIYDKTKNEYTLLGTTKKGSPLDISALYYIDDKSKIMIGDCYFVTMPDDFKTDQELVSSIEVRFDNDVQIKVEPDDPIEFEAEGGSKTLTVTTNQPKWGGIKKGDWFKVETTTNTITLTADPNPTSDPREGYIEVYARNENKENVSEPIVIPIKQKAKAAEIFDNLKNISVSFKTTMHYYGNGKTGVDYYDEDKSTGRSFPAYGFEDKQKKDIKVTYSGNTAHIEGSWTYDFIRDDQRYKHETVIKMDITNFNDIKNAVITNLSAEELHQYYYSKNGGWELSIWEKGSISASNIPMKNKYGAEGTNKNGAVLNDCFDEGLDGWHRYTWTFLPNQDFSVSVSFSYSE